MNVKKIISHIYAPFNFDSKQQLEFILPLERGHVSTQFLSQKEIQASINTILNFTKGTIVANASTETPSHIKFISKNLIPNFFIRGTIFNDDRRPAELKSTFHCQKKDYQIRQSLQVVFKVLPLSSEALNRSYYDIEAVTKVFNPAKSLRIGFLTESKILSIGGLLRILPNVDFAANFEINNLYKIAANFLSMTSFGKTKASSIFNFETRSLKYIFERPINQKVTTAVMLGFDHIGKYAKFDNKIAANIKIDDDSNLHLIADFNRTLSGKLTVHYQDFLDFEFTGKTHKTSRGFENKFGAVVTFDMRNRKEFQMF